MILGLDIGGANLKAATSAGRAASVPFAVWKHPEQLGAELAKLIGQFPEANSLAVTMTAELCDCYETKREGVNKILDAVAACGKPFQVWSTDGKFISMTAARKAHMKVAAANWHALATFAGRFVPKGPALLIDMGTTTTDIIPMKDGLPITIGKTDTERMDNHELLYQGWRRTPAMILHQASNCATELFATAADAYVVTGMKAESPSDHDTADNRPMTVHHCKARLARMMCGDLECIDDLQIRHYAHYLVDMQSIRLRRHIGFVQNHQLKRFRKPMPLILSGSGRFALHYMLSDEFKDLQDRMKPFAVVLELADKISTQLEEAAPAYAVAVLAAEATGKVSGRP